MKILKLFMFLLLSSQIVTYAGSFTQDPLVLELRNSFSKSKSPTLNELRLGKYWECKTHSTMPNDLSIENNYFKFYLDGERLRTSINNHTIFYKFENQNLITSMATKEPYFVYHDVVRINKKGSLIAEQTMEYLRQSDARKYYGDPSIVFKNGIAAKYTFCNPTDKNYDVAKKKIKKPNHPRPRPRPKTKETDQEKSDSNSAPPVQSQPRNPQPVTPVTPVDSVDREDDGPKCVATGFCQSTPIGSYRTDSYYVRGEGDTPSEALSDLSCSGDISMRRVSCQ